MNCCTLVLILACLHLNTARDFRAFNPGIGITAPISSYRYFRMEAGVYRNSYAHPSAYWLVRTETRGDRLRVGFAYGGVTGYPRYSVLPLGFVYSDVRLFRGVRVRGQVLPSRQPIVGLSVEIGQ